LRREDDARQQVEYFVKSWPTDLRAYLLQARLDVYWGRFAQAGRSFREVLEREPANPDALAGLGRVFLETEQYDESRRLLRRATRIGGPRADALGAESLLKLLDENQIGGAWRMSESALQLDPGEPVANYVRGVLYRGEGDGAAMLYHFRRTLLREPHYLRLVRFLNRAEVDPEELIQSTELSPPPPRR
jgi:tetratricopeptide (TPR) repeat protein